MEVDIKTLIMAACITGLLQTTIMFALFYINKKYKGFGCWVLGSLFVTLGFVLFIFREIDSLELPSVLLSNLLIIGGLLYIYVGIIRFFYHKENTYVFSIFMLIYSSLSFYFIYINNNFAARIFIFSVAVVMIFLPSAWTIIKNKNDSIKSSTNFLAAVLLIISFFFVLRAGHIFTNISTGYFFEPTLFQVGVFVAAIILNYAWTVGVIIMFNQRLALELTKAQRELEIKNTMLLEQSTTDGLTKVKNHRALMEYLEAETVNAVMTKKPLSIALFDLDDFKDVNDTKGHLYGDQVLIEVARIMQNNIRDNDKVGRYGGEEFMIIFLNADENAARSISKRISTLIEEQYKDDLGITISGGIAEYSGESISDFINGADQRLYEAKRQGKNRII